MTAQQDMQQMADRLIALERTVADIDRRRAAAEAEVLRLQSAASMKITRETATQSSPHQNPFVVGAKCKLQSCIV